MPTILTFETKNSLQQIRASINHSLSLLLEDRSELQSTTNLYLFHSLQQIRASISVSLSPSQVSREYNPSLSRIIGKIKTLEIYTFYGLILILSYFAFERVLFQDSSQFLMLVMTLFCKNVIIQLWFYWRLYCQSMRMPFFVFFCLMI